MQRSAPMTRGPMTESAAQARKSFYCELCSKGYTRATDYDAHLSSYDHSHKKRLQDMKQMQRDPNQTAKARERERKEMGLGGMITIKPIELKESAAASKKAGFKKSGFKSTFGQVSAPEPAKKDGEEGGGGTAGGIGAGGKLRSAEAGPNASEESDTEDDGSYERYDPAYPTS